ncbi:MAG TPA: hypothetical protein VFX30_10965 [bacterium]|nr:hypothetical protein [bacterium]
MTLTIVSTSITEARLREIAGPISSYVSVPTSDRMAVIAEVQRRDYSHLIVEGTRGGDGVLRYFARIDRGARIPVAAGERITAVYYGDQDGDGADDVIVRLETGGLQVFLARESTGPSASSAETSSGTSAPSTASNAESAAAYDPEPYDPEPDVAREGAGGGGQVSSGPPVSSVPSAGSSEQ